MKLPKFLQNRIRLLKSGMLHWFVSSNTGKGETAKLLGNFYAGGSLIDATGLIYVRLATVVCAMARQVVSDPHQRAPQATICLTDDWSAVVRLIALVT